MLCVQGNNIKTLSMQSSKYMNCLVCLPSVGRIRRKGIICESVRPRSLVAVIVTVWLPGANWSTPMTKLRSPSNGENLFQWCIPKSYKPQMATDHFVLHNETQIMIFKRPSTWYIYLNYVYIDAHNLHIWFTLFSHMTTKGTWYHAKHAGTTIIATEMALLML